VLFIVSDGEDHEGSFLETAAEASKMGIRIFTIGVGTLQGGPIPIKRYGVLQSYKRDSNGEQVITRLDQENLIDIAQTANGEYIDGTNTNEVIEKVTAILNGMDKKEFEAKQFTDFKDQFQWFLAGALFLLILDVLLLERKTKWVKKLNLFNENNA
jgi:Ca-activated chloride channel family protein